MKKTLIYISAAMLASVGLSSCNDNWTTPPLDDYFPQSNWKANETIEALKTANWKSDRNYVETIGQNADNQDIIIKGRVISESASGNIYNSIVIQQENGGPALNIAVRTNKLTTIPPFGQEILVNVTGLKIGGYNGLMQLGAEGTYNNAPSMTFMESADFEAKFEPNGAPNLALVDTMVVDDLAELATAKGSDAGLIKWQSQLVRVNNVTFKEQGVPYAGSSNTNRYVKDANGNELNVRTSSYATFKDALTPAGTGSVTGILSYYGSDWQLLLNDTTGVKGFEPVENPGTPDDPGKPDDPVNPGEGGDGTEANPFTVAQIIGGATGTEVWSKGYIVGWVEGQVLKDGAHFDAASTVASNILIAASADVKDVANCVPVQLSSGTDARTKLNLKDNPGVLGKEVALKGNLEKYFGTAGIKSVTAYKIDGASSDPETPDTPGEAVTTISEGFDGGSIPAGWSQIQEAGDKTWYTPSYQDNYYAAMTGYKGTAPFDQWLLTPAIDMSKATDKVLSFITQVNGYGSKTSKLEVYVLTTNDLKTATKTQLKPALATAPDSGYSSWVESGALDLSAFTGTVYIAFRYVATEDANYATWCVDNVKVNVK